LLVLWLELVSFLLNINGSTGFAWTGAMPIPNPLVSASMSPTCDLSLFSVGLTVESSLLAVFFKLSL